MIQLLSTGGAFRVSELQRAQELNVLLHPISARLLRIYRAVRGCSLQI